MRLVAGIGSHPQEENLGRRVRQGADELALGGAAKGGDWKTTSLAKIPKMQENPDRVTTREQ